MPEATLTRGGGTAIIGGHGPVAKDRSFVNGSDRLRGGNDVITLDLRGHGESGTALTYDLASMAGDVLTVVDAAGLDRPHLVGPSRGGAGVTHGVWGLLLTQPVVQIADTVDAALAGFELHPVPYLALFGIDPGDGYADWLAARIPGALVEHWEQHGHYPHLVDPDRFVDRLHDFWG